MFAMFNFVCVARSMVQKSCIRQYYKDQKANHLLRYAVVITIVKAEITCVFMVSLFWPIWSFFACMVWILLLFILLIIYYILLTWISKYTPCITSTFIILYFTFTAKTCWRFWLLKLRNAFPVGFVMEFIMFKLPVVSIFIFLAPEKCLTCPLMDI